MSFEQKRNAERLPLDAPIEGTASGSPVKIVELSAIGCRIEHKEKLNLGSATTLKFKWNDIAVELRARVARMQLRPGMVYESGLQFADSLEEAPEVMRSIIASLTADELPPEIMPTETATTETAPPLPAEEDVEEMEMAEAVDFEDIDVTARVKAKYVECRLENGVWHRQPVAVVLQPPEGFITLPADDQELDMLCKSYEYADPDTRRLIRISLELTATQKQD